MAVMGREGWVGFLVVVLLKGLFWDGVAVMEFRRGYSGHGFWEQRAQANSLLSTMGKTSRLVN